jgi:hypothetical protein
MLSTIIIIVFIFIIRKWYETLKWSHKDIGWGDTDWVYLSRDTNQGIAL